MQCTLNIPHLIPPRELASLWQELHAPALKALLARARYRRQPATEALPDAIAFFDSAAAPLLAAYDGLAAQTGYWLCATPVHLQTSPRALVLADPATLDLPATESAALAATIAEHVRGDGMVLHTPASGRWYLQCAAPPAITTTPLHDVIGREIQTLLPQGPEAMRWHRLLTEIQMLLHAHPVNGAREAAGRLAVNSVWLWGGGVMPELAAAAFSAVCSDDPLICATAQRAGCRVDSGTPRFPHSLEAKGHYYFSFHALTPLMRRGDLRAWGAAVTALDHDWFQPLQAELRAHRVTRATLICGAHELRHRFDIGPWDFLKIFNIIKYLE